MLRSNTAKYSLFIIIYFFCLHVISFAQLRADFTVSKQIGCSPLTVSFTNTTGGASASAQYEWDFDNGNTSSLKNAGAVFIEQRTYNITLRVKDGNQTATKTQTVTVSQKPVVDFSTSLVKGCTPQLITFSSKSTANNGTIVNYTWDFGDGFTGKSSTPQITHTYLSSQKASVTLAVTDNNGCTNTKTINDLVNILPGVKASFNADKTFVCFENDPVKLINASIGEGILNYKWDFGDGITSTEKDPSHSFNTKGIYTVRLAVQSELGCTDTLTKTAYLNVGNFQSQFTVPDIICKNSTVEIKNTSTPAPTSSSWLIDGTQTVYPDYGRYNYTFYTAGEHTIQLTNKFGTCEEKVTKKVEVKELLQPKGFVTEIPAYCAPPVTVKFQDTTAGALKSEWIFDYYGYPQTIQATGKSVSHSFNQAYNSYVTLFVTDANGCKNSVQQPITIMQPQVYIQTSDNTGYYACNTLTKKFKINTNEPLASFTWYFGDGATSTDSEPEHTFGPGIFAVKLRYTTARGCSGEVTNYNSIEVSQKPKADFTSLTPTTICGNSFAIFEKKPDNNSYYHYWVIDGTLAGGNYSNFNYQFNDTGKHTISLIVYNSGCRDTMTRVNYITVLPSFPKISQWSNTCDGDRGTVTFKQSSRYATKWVWDFGDGATVSYNTDEPSINHHYTKSGEYKVVLTTSNGQCINRDSIRVMVLLKENPILSATKTSICIDEEFRYTLTNLNVNLYSNFNLTHYIEKYQYNDGTTFSPDYYTWFYTMPYNGSIRKLENGKESIRIITREGYFNCYDTSNYIPIKITGATAGFEITTNNVCFKLPVSFRDTSTAQNTSIISRQWNFGDGQTQTVTSGGNVSHTYANPGAYYVTLKVTDATGCTSTTSSYTQMVSVNGPKAIFSVSQINAHLKSTIYFYNNTNNYNNYNAQYEWQFGDGSTSTLYSPSYTYSKPGNYKIRLIAKNPISGCTDTAYQDILIRDFNVNFSFTSSFVNNVECSPVLVQFNNTSSNYTHVKWDFGDGTTSDNTNNPTHLYTLPGKYIIKLFVTGYNGLSNTYLDSVIIKENKVDITADKLYGCTSQSVTLSTITKNISSYLWDFGDGTIVQASDTFSVHHYQKPGIYIPHLIGKDVNGCAASVSLGDKIIIDSLSVALKNVPEKICTPKEIGFDPAIVSVASDRQNLIYHWNFGTGNAKDTSNMQRPSFTFLQPGNYQIDLTVRSPYGCNKAVQVTIAANQGLGGKINGPQEICQQSTVQFTGNTLLSGQPKWQWIFHDGTTVSQQNPPTKQYDIAGIFPVKLLVDNNGCVDTITQLLEVHPKPTVVLSAKQAVVCEGSQLSITAGGGSIYAWSPATGLDNTNKNIVIATPLTNTTYQVSVTDVHGCINKDSVKIRVAHPFKLQLASEVAVCLGKSIEIKTSGAATYQWIQNTEGLSNLTIANPVAKPTSTISYKVAGADADHCFTDTANIKVTVKPLPVVDAGAGAEILTGSSYQLQGTTSNDVVKWDWTPSKYLNCTNCLSPIATPLEPMMYTLTATNALGCSASDTVSVKLLCSESRIYIPNAFTPNNDGLNDVFLIKGVGIRIVNRLTIYDRWGHLVFERSNFLLDDKSAAWDGKYKGLPVPAGVYVYSAEMSCNEKTFTQKGSVAVIY